MNNKYKYHINLKLSKNFIPEKWHKKGLQIDQSSARNYEGFEQRKFVGRGGTQQRPRGHFCTHAIQSARARLFKFYPETS